MSNEEIAAVIAALKANNATAIEDVSVGTAEYLLGVGSGDTLVKVSTGDLLTVSDLSSSTPDQGAQSTAIATSQRAVYNAIAAKADASALGGYVTQSALATALSGKADASALEDEATTRSQADTALSLEVASKANAADVYTRAEIGAMLDDKADVSDLPTIMQATGSSTTAVMSQNAVTTALNDKADASDVNSRFAALDTDDIGVGETQQTQARTLTEWIEEKQDELRFDTTPKANSLNPVTSGGIKSALDTLQQWIDDVEHELVNYTPTVQADARYALKNGSANEAFNVSSIDFAGGTTMGGAYIGLTQNGELLISDRSGDYTIAHAETTYTKNEVDVLMDEMSLQVDDVQTGYVNADEAIKASIPSLAFRELAVTMGAVWNASTGFFELNGLTDITEAQMRNIIRYTGNYRPQGDMNSALRGKNANGTIVGFRTNFCNHAYIYSLSELSTSMKYFANANRLLEVVRLTNGNEVSERLRPTSLQFAFNNCSALRQIIGDLDVRQISVPGQMGNSFTGCTALESVSIYSLGVSLSLADSPNLTAASVATMVGQAQTGKELTVTLHDTAYTRAVADADVKAASQARPLVTILNATGDKKMGGGETYHKETLDGVEAWVKDPVGSDGSEDSGTIN